MFTRRIGLASRSASVDLPELVKVAAALSVQVSRDFAPIWDVSAVVSALPDPDAVEPGVWPIYVVDQLGFGGALGLHLTGENQPYALVEAGKTWSLTASHECLEMLVDPQGSMLRTSTALQIVDGKVQDDPGRKVDYLVEVADPSEDPGCAYLIDDVLVCDFYTQNFFDPVVADGVRYSFSGKLTAPRQVLDGGYLSWLDPTTGRMQQLKMFGAPVITTLPGKPSQSSRRSLRGFVDENTPPPIALSRADPLTAAGGARAARAAWLLSAAAGHASTFTASRRTAVPAAPGSDQAAVQAAIQANVEQLRVPGATRMYAGWHFENGWITHARAIVVQARRSDMEAVRDALPDTLGGFAIDVRQDPRPQRSQGAPGAAMFAAAGPGTLRAELALPEMPGELVLDGRGAGAAALAAATAAARVGKPHVPYAPPAGASLAPVTGDMVLRLHVSPDRGWPELRTFLSGVRGELVVGMYEMTAAHVETALLEGLGQTARLTMTMDSPPDSKPRGQTVEQAEEALEQALTDRLDFAWALSGLGKEAPAVAFPTAYHIKVAVKDGRSVWLSSGNWNVSNQPEIDPADEPGLATAAAKSDRDWHVIVESPELAGVFRAYLDADYAEAGRAEQQVAAAALAAAGPGPQSPDLDGVAALAARVPRRFFDTKVVRGHLTVRPLLTPDEGGYRAPILELIKSAKNRLYMQTQYIHTVDPATDAGSPGHMDLIKALAERIASGVDVRLITSEYQDAMWIERLQDAGVDCVDHLRIQARVHNKGIVVDTSIVVVSSQNWSGEGTGTNRDAGLIIYSPEAAQYFEEIFLHDWLNMSAPKLAGHG